MEYFGDYAEDDTVYLMFNTFTSNDPSASCTITNFINTDVHIHKDDAVAQRNNAAGITVSVDFDGITGSHLIKIDTNDNTVAGFWVAAHDYFVRIEGTTIDGATINAVVGSFSIENRFMRGTDSAATETKQDIIDTNVDSILTDTGTTLDTLIKDVPTVSEFNARSIVSNDYVVVGDTIAGVTLCTTCTTNSDMRGTDNAATETKQDVIDTNVDSILTDTGTTLDALIKDIPTVPEFEARSMASADYVVVGDTIAGVTLCTTCTTNTDMVGTDGANTVVPDAAGVAATPAEVATALTDIHLDHLLAANYDPAAKPGVATALLNEIIENDGGVSRYTSNALEQAPSGSGATAAEVRIEIDANSTKLSSIETDTKGISDTAACSDAGSPTTNSLADIVRKMKWFVANLWEIDENATPDTFKIFKDDNLAVGLNFTVYTDSSKSYRDNTP